MSGHCILLSAALTVTSWAQTIAGASKPVLAVCADASVLIREVGGADCPGTHNNLKLNRARAYSPVSQEKGSKNADLKQQLERYRWTLVLATDANHRRIAGLPPAQDHRVVFSFDGSRLSVLGPCNQFAGEYQFIAANKVKVDLGASTMMACDPAFMQAESVLINLLAKPLQIQMTDHSSARLHLVSPGNGILSFTGEPTPESLYGAGATVFLEIAAQSVDCPNPPPPNTHCLQYRERHYDDKGLVVGTPGEWMPLTVRIEGFTHREGVRNVLRVKQFQTPASSGSVPSDLYVLDLVVESEIVKP